MNVHKSNDDRRLEDEGIVEMLAFLFLLALACGVIAVPVVIVYLQGG